ncbi:hypothetical protein [Microvirga aerophila]|nr:hypothetical protein [Microvirga aerophila]
MVWQVGAGDAERNYAELCLRWGVILNGPGYDGPWPNRNGISPRKAQDLQRFCERIQDGDLVVLKVGKSEVYGVGHVRGDYEWNDHFGDVDGWDIQHLRRVDWVWQASGGPKRFSGEPLKWGDTTQVLTSPDVLTWIASLQLTPNSRILPVLPQAKESLIEVRPQEISEFLFDNGVSAHSTDLLMEEIEKLIRIAKWYERSHTTPSEYETISYLVIPLFRALGWTPQRMAVEWDRIDVALFARMPRQKDTLTAVVEAKQRNRACLTARSQAFSYAQRIGFEGCQRLIVTDGIRYGVFQKLDGAFLERPTAYLNLTRMVEDYPVLGCAGVKQALYLMAADWVR